MNQSFKGISLHKGKAGAFYLSFSDGSHKAISVDTALQWEINRKLDLLLEAIKVQTALINGESNEK